MYPYEKQILLPGFTCSTCRCVKDEGRFKLEREFDRNGEEVKGVRYYVTLTCDDCLGKPKKKTKNRAKAKAAAR